MMTPPRSRSTPIISRDGIAPSFYQGLIMPSLYRVRAHETGTHRDLINDASSSSFRIAILYAERWASSYYGENGATWFKASATDRFIAGRFYDDGYRELGSCIISVEACEDDARDQAG